jgi:hypothetical protein
MWGVVYQTSNGAGFALEFVGDMHDSVNLGKVIDADSDKAVGFAIGQNTVSGGRGIN